MKALRQLYYQEQRLDGKRAGNLCRNFMRMFRLQGDGLPYRQVPGVWLGDGCYGGRFYNGYPFFKKYKVSLTDKEDFEPEKVSNEEKHFMK